MHAVRVCCRSSSGAWETYLAAAQAPPPPSASWSLISGGTSKKCDELGLDDSATSPTACRELAEQTGSQYYSANGHKCRHGSTCTLVSSVGDWETYMHNN